MGSIWRTYVGGDLSDSLWKKTPPPQLTERATLQSRKEGSKQITE